MKYLLITYVLGGLFWLLTKSISATRGNGFGPSPSLVLLYLTSVLAFNGLYFSLTQTP